MYTHYYYKLPWSATNKCTEQSFFVLFRCLKGAQKKTAESTSMSWSHSLHSNNNVMKKQSTENHAQNVDKKKKLYDFSSDWILARGNRHFSGSFFEREKKNMPNHMKALFSSRLCVSLFCSASLLPCVLRTTDKQSPDDICLLSICYWILIFKRFVFVSAVWKRRRRKKIHFFGLADTTPLPKKEIIQRTVAAEYM